MADQPGMFDRLFGGGLRIGFPGQPPAVTIGTTSQAPIQTDAQGNALPGQFALPPSAFQAGKNLAQNVGGLARNITQSGGRLAGALAPSPQAIEGAQGLGGGLMDFLRGVAGAPSRAQAASNATAASMGPAMGAAPTAPPAPAPAAPAPAPPAPAPAPKGNIPIGGYLPTAADQGGMSPGNTLVDPVTAEREQILANMRNTSDPRLLDSLGSALQRLPSPADNARSEMLQISQKVLGAKIASARQALMSSHAAALKLTGADQQKAFETAQSQYENSVLNEYMNYYKELFQVGYPNVAPLAYGQQQQGGF